jgi:hypothetical protein
MYTVALRISSPGHIETYCYGPISHPILQGGFYTWSNGTLKPLRHYPLKSWLAGV